MLSIAGTLTTSSAAQAATDSVAERMKTLDPDNDATMDPAEANKAGEAKFDSLDGYHDETLELKEMISTKVRKETFTRRSG